MVVATGVLTLVGAGCGWAVGTETGWRVGWYRVLLSASLLPAGIYVQNVIELAEGVSGGRLPFTTWWSVGWITALTTLVVSGLMVWVVRRWWAVGLALPLLVAMLLYEVFVPSMGRMLGTFRWYDNVATVWLFAYSVGVTAFLGGYGVGGHNRVEDGSPLTAA